MKTKIVVEIESVYMAEIFDNTNTPYQEELEQEIHSKTLQAIKRYVDEELEYEILDSLEHGDKDVELLSDYGKFKINVRTE